MPFDIIKVSRVGLAIWLAGAGFCIWRLLFDRDLSAYVVGVLMLTVIFLPVLLAALAMRPGSDAPIGHLMPRDAVQPNNNL